MLIDEQHRFPRLEIDIFQIAGDEMFRGRRPDGTGWDWEWADWRRDWMDRTPSKFAYRCLPLTIANQLGWWVSNPVGFTAIWHGRPEPKNVTIIFDSDSEMWSGWINDQFGHGIVTWNTPFLFRTRPAGSRLIVCGPSNYFKHGIQPLTALIESDWITSSFTMNWKITAPELKIRFDQGEPLFQVIPLPINLGQSLEDAKVRYLRLAEAPDMAEAYRQWDAMRRKFHQQKQDGEVQPDEWQRDYFRGRDALGRTVASGHQTKVNAPSIEFRSPKP